jgi:MFS family permease
MMRAAFFYDAFLMTAGAPLEKPREDAYLPPLLTRDFVLLCLVTLGFFFSFFFFFPTLPFFIQHLGGRESDVGLLIGVSSLVAFVVKPLAGRWVDHHGRTPLITTSVTLFACAAVLHVWTFSLAVLLFLRVFYGAAIGCFTTASGAYLADIAPPARRGEATSYWGLVNSLAMGVAPPFALGLMSSKVLHPLETHLARLLPGLTETIAWEDNFVLLFLTAAGIASVAGLVSRGMREAHTPAPLRTRRPLYAREALLPTAVNFCLYLTFTSYTTFLPLYARALGMGNAGFLYSAYALALMSTRVLGARIGDRYGRAAVIVPGLACVLVAFLVFASALGPAFLYLGVSLYGLGIGLAQPGLSAFTIDRLMPERRGLGMSTFGQGLDLGMGVGGMLMGAIATQAGFPFMYLCGSGCAGIGLAIFLWGTRSKTP